MPGVARRLTPCLLAQPVDPVPGGALGYVRERLVEPLVTRPIVPLREMPDNRRFGQRVGTSLSRLRDWVW